MGYENSAQIEVTVSDNSIGKREIIAKIIEERQKLGYRTADWEKKRR